MLSFGCVQSGIGPGRKRNLLRLKKVFFRLDAHFIAKTLRLLTSALDFSVLSLSVLNYKGGDSDKAFARQSHHTEEFFFKARLFESITDLPFEHDGVLI